MVTIKSDLDIETDKDTNICPNILPETDDLDSLPSSQNTIADEEESREYIEYDEKCDNCKMTALKLKISENRVKYLQDQRVVEKKLRKEEVKKRKQETICRTEEITILSKKVCKYEDDIAESERKRIKLEQDNKAMQRIIETLQREKENDQMKVRKLEMKNKTLEEEKSKMGVLVKGLNGMAKGLNVFFEKNKDSSKSSEDVENVRVNSNGVLAPKKRKEQ